ncbi:MAG: flagellar hook-basal body protein [Firmicutes bacterium HGW-Firmicutes-14]|nr:MAG: flagellar hook-basal body protein [Firmicutes bacterium HGW-Firmicutes-14]
MMRSMFSGVSGLRNHQIRMDVIGNNIANVNTVGFKRSRATFRDMLSQNIRGASSPEGGKGGTNPQQVGLGMTLNSIDTIHSQGSSEITGKITDLMVDGDGFFIVGDGSNRFYTRAGNFDFDAAGNLISGSGMLVQGWMADAAGNIDTAQAITGITIPKGMAILPEATENVTYINNLDAGTPIDGAGVDGTVPTTIQAYDSLGNMYNIPALFRKTAANTWNFEVPAGTLPANITAAVVANPAITFNADGTFNTPDPPTTTVALTIDPLVGATSPQTITVDFTAMTQYANPSNAGMNTQDGYSSGMLTGYAIDKSGVVTGRFSNGFTKELAQVALANFNNPGGLIKVGENMFTESNNSGTVQLGVAGTGGRGEISPGTLEMSNVDLSQEFTDMIITQRGFQANTRIITVSDEMLQELVNLKR